MALHKHVGGARRERREEGQERRKDKGIGVRAAARDGVDNEWKKGRGGGGGERGGEKGVRRESNSKQSRRLFEGS